jgi:hypothetical protein
MIFSDLLDLGDQKKRSTSAIAFSDRSAAADQEN